jgi:hypothetical protein
MKVKQSLAVAFTADNDLGFRRHARLNARQFGKQKRKEKTRKTLPKTVCKLLLGFAMLPRQSGMTSYFRKAI